MRPLEFLLPNSYKMINRFGDAQGISLLKWATANTEKTKRLTAINLMESILKVCLSSFQIPDDALVKLLGIFGELENVYRTAIETKKPGTLREHLEHTIRDLMFSLIIFDKIATPNERSDPDNIKRLATAAIFHDFGYPLEKIKEAAESLDFLAAFKSTETKLKPELVDPEGILNILDRIGNLDGNSYKRLYQECLCEAIAGRGMYETRHNLSSVVLFLYPIVNSGINERYWTDKENDILEVCNAIVYHDRNTYPREKLSTISSALRIADELQEWERDEKENTYVESVSLEEDANYGFAVEYHMKNKLNGDKCNPAIAVADKLVGLIPACERISIKLIFRFPSPVGTKFPDKIKEILYSYNNKFINMHFLSSDDLPEWNKIIDFSHMIKARKNIIVEVRGLTEKTKVISDE